MKVQLSVIDLAFLIDLLQMHKEGLAQSNLNDDAVKEEYIQTCEIQYYLKTFTG